jgi:hypothetical protein
MTLRDLTGNPELERHEIDDAARFDSVSEPMPCQTPDLDESDADFEWRMKEQMRDEREEAMAAFDKLIAALKAAGEREGYGKHLPEVA